MIAVVSAPCVFAVPVVDASQSESWHWEKRYVAFNAFALFLRVIPATAYTNSCPIIVAAIDAAISTATLGEVDKTKVMEFRAQGKKLHAAGDHAVARRMLETAGLSLSDNALIRGLELLDNKGILGIRSHQPTVQYLRHGSGRNGCR